MNLEDFLKGFASGWQPKNKESERCTAARKEKNPLPCRFMPLSKIVICTIHNGLKV